ncbi:NUDIX hydrolase [Flavobacterium sp. J372]|uniref:NUDIX hydrolase n=1 Tax=Flavobacterium sp. J372 TaxID=2898436 RepID=UPI002150E2E5|nr:NUDIX hydrolase [Flavobacterium sp. J372]MCR5862509.1 NUDIX hydrolase [Flavobacterium sp. J372]
MRKQNIAITVDAIVFRGSKEKSEILFIKRKNDPFKGNWALPGGFVDEGENLPDAAARELLEETGVVTNAMVQLGAFGKPGRDPRGHTISIAYIAFVEENTEALGADDADEAKWFSVKKLPEMAFDHAEIVNLALQKVML